MLATRGAGLGTAAPRRPQRSARASLRVRVLRRPGAREVLIAQTLWVFAYAALPDVLRPLRRRDARARASASPARCRWRSARSWRSGWRSAGARAAERVHGLLLTGAALLGAGLLAASTTLAARRRALPLAAAALGRGARRRRSASPTSRASCPQGEEGGYSGVFFAGRGVASAAALPLAGVAVELTGTYRTVLWLGAAAFLALRPADARRAPRRGRRRRRSLARPSRDASPPSSPCSTRRAPPRSRARRSRHVDRVVLVDDGAPAAIAASIAPLADDDRVRVRAPSATTAARAAPSRPACARCSTRRARRPRRSSSSTPTASTTPAASPRSSTPRATPTSSSATGATGAGCRSRAHRATALASVALLASTRRWIPDTQNGMRLFRTDALRREPVPERRLRRREPPPALADRGGRRIASVEIPTIYDGEPSHFRPVADTIAVGRALLVAARAGRAAPRRPRRARDLRALARAHRRRDRRDGAIAIGARCPLLQPADNQLFLAINGLGDGPEWLYQALDPHARNYGLHRRAHGRRQRDRATAACAT